MKKVIILISIILISTGCAQFSSKQDNIDTMKNSLTASGFNCESNFCIQESNEYYESYGNVEVDLIINFNTASIIYEENGETRQRKVIYNYKSEFLSYQQTGIKDGEPQATISGILTPQNGFSCSGVFCETLEYDSLSMKSFFHRLLSIDGLSIDDIKK